MNHSPEPWFVELYQGDTLIRNKNPNEFPTWIAEMSKRPNDHENAERIRDCVNTCAGIEKPQEAIVQAREALSRALDILGKDHYPVTFQLCKNALALLGDKPK